MELAYSIISPYFWLYFFAFICALLPIWALGNLIIEKAFTKFSVLSTIDVFVLSSIVGMVLFTATGFLFGLLHIRSFQYGVWLVGLFLLLRKRKNFSTNFVTSLTAIKKSDRGLLTLSFVGILAQLLVVVPSGLKTSAGIIFHQLQAIDGMLHLAFIDSLAKSLPPLQPGASGLFITNYHYWSDLFLAELHRLFGLPILHLYYHFVPPLIAIGLTVTLLRITTLLGGTITTKKWVLFFHFFAGNLVPFGSLLLHKTILWHTPAIDHGMLQFTNVPQAFAKMVFFAGLLVFLYWYKNPSIAIGSILALLFGSLFGFKVYFGIFAVLLLTLVGGIQFVSARKARVPIALTYLLLGLVSLAIYAPTNRNAGGLFYVPLAWPKILISPEQLNWREWWLRMQVYEAHGNTRNSIAMQGILASLFVVLVAGTRLFGLAAISKKLYSHRTFVIAAAVVSIVFFYVGMNTLQTSGGANVFNFFVVALTIMGIFAAFTLEHLLSLVKNRFIRLSIVLLVVVTSVIRPVYDLGTYTVSIFSQKNSILVTAAELRAFNFIRLNIQPAALVQSHPGDNYDYETPYLSFFTGAQGYVSGENILLSHNQPIQTRIEELNLAHRGGWGEFALLMNEKRMQYLYIRNAHSADLFYDVSNPTNKYFSVAFQEDEVLVLTPKTNDEIKMLQKQKITP